MNENEALDLEMFLDSDKLTEEEKAKKEAPRFITGLHSFDKAVGGNGRDGLALRALITVYGASMSGKSTFAHSLLARICGHTGKNVSMLNIEDMDKRFLVNIFKSNSFACPPSYIKEIKVGEKIEPVLQELYEDIRDGRSFCGILDSAGAVATVAELLGDIGDRNPGGRAFIMNQFCRRMNFYLQDGNDGVMFAISHQYQNIGGMAYQYIPGGQGLNYFSHYRIHLKATDKYDGNYMVKGEVKKSKYGPDKGLFQVYMLRGKGIHDGMTAILDCQAHKLVTKPKTIASVMTTKKGLELPSFKKYLALAHEGNTEEFQIFYDLLREKE